MNVIGKKQLLVSAFLGKYCLLIGISSCLLKFLPALISLTYFPSKGIYKPIQPILLWLLSKVQWHSLIFPHDLNVRNFEQLPQKKWWSKSNKVKEKKKKKIKENHNSLSLYYELKWIRNRQWQVSSVGYQRTVSVNIHMLGFVITRSEKRQGFKRTKLRYW